MKYTSIEMTQGASGFRLVGNFPPKDGERYSSEHDTFYFSTLLDLLNWLQHINDPVAVAPRGNILPVDRETFSSIVNKQSPIGQ